MDDLRELAQEEEWQAEFIRVRGAQDEMPAWEESDEEDSHDETLLITTT